MTPESIFYIIIAIITIDFMVERLLEYLNSTRLSPKLPQALEGIYDAEKYQKSQQYEKETTRFGLVADSFNFVLIMLMLFLGGFVFIDQLARHITEHYILISLVFFGILMLASDIISLPFSIYSTFVIEQKYGFNTTTRKTFILDKLKGWLLGIVIGGGILALIIWLFYATGQWFWLLAWGAVGAFSVFMTFFYSSLIVPLFNKQTPLEEGELRSAIENFCKEAGFELKNIYVIDGSKRSTKANAYFTGFGSKKRVVLYDTLIDDMSTEEIVAVLAHEIGHYKKKHIVTGMVLSLLQTGLMFYILSVFIANPLLTQAMGYPEAEVVFHLALIAFGILYSPLSTLLGLGSNVLSRKHEYQADAFARYYEKGEALASALKKLSVKNLSNLTPHPAYVFVYYSHPPLLKRLKTLKQKQ